MTDNKNRQWAILEAVLNFFEKYLRSFFLVPIAYFFD